MNNLPNKLKLRRQNAYEGKLGDRCRYDLNHKSNFDLLVLWHLKMNYNTQKVSKLGKQLFNKSYSL